MFPFEDKEALRILKKMHLITTLLKQGTLSVFCFKYLRALQKYHSGQGEYQENIKTSYVKVLSHFY